MAAGHPAAQPQPLGFICQRLHVAGHRIVAFVAMQVQHQATFCSDLSQPGHRPPAIGHGAFEMRDAADHIHAHIQRAQQVFFGSFRPIQTILRKGDQLQIDIRRNLFAHLQQRFDPDQRCSGHIHMRPDCQQPL